MLRTKSSYTVEFKLSALEYLDNVAGGSIAKAAREFGVDRKRIRDWREQRDVLRQHQAGNNGNKRKLHGGRVVRSEELDLGVLEFFDKERALGRFVRDKDLMMRALELAGTLHVKNFAASAMWLDRWKKRHDVASRCGFQTMEKQSVGASETYTGSPHQIPKAPGSGENGLYLTSAGGEFQYASGSSLASSETQTESPHLTLKALQSGESGSPFVSPPGLKDTFPVTVKMEMIDDQPTSSQEGLGPVSAAGLKEMFPVPVKMEMPDELSSSSREGFGQNLAVDGLEMSAFPHAAVKQEENTVTGDDTDEETEGLVVTFADKPTDTLEPTPTDPKSPSHRKASSLRGKRKATTPVKRRADFVVYIDNAEEDSAESFHSLKNDCSQSESNHFLGLKHEHSGIGSNNFGDSCLGLNDGISKTGAHDFGVSSGGLSSEHSESGASYFGGMHQHGVNDFSQSAGHFLGDGYYGLKDDQSESAGSESERTKKEEGEMKTAVDGAQQKMGRPKKKKLLGPRVCKICEKVCANVDTLKKHMVVHSSERRYKCDLCPKDFQRQNELKCHKMFHLGLRDHMCQVCGKSFCRPCDLKSHMLVHTDFRPLSCDVCGRTFKEQKTLKNHKLLHSDVRPFSCDVCGKSFVIASSLKAHKCSAGIAMANNTLTEPSANTVGLEESANGEVEKEQAGSTSSEMMVPETSTPGMVTPGNTTPSKEIPRKASPSTSTAMEAANKIKQMNLCPECGKWFKHSKNVKDHLRSFHKKGEALFTCNVCDRSFFKHNNYVGHVNGHLGIKAFTCKKCQKSFFYEQSLKRHTAACRPQPTNPTSEPISELATIPCEECGKVFVSKAKLVEHAWVHKTDLRYGCDQCQQRFKYRSSLKKHKDSKGH